MDERVETRRSEDRWSSPRTILAVAQLMLTLGSFAFVVMVSLVGTYVMMQTRDTTSEISNAQLAQQVGVLSGKMDKFNEMLSASVTGTAELKSGVETIKRDLDREAEERKSRDEWLEARIVSGK